jgi:Domain of Unknown Function (DUF748)
MSFQPRPTPTPRPWRRRLTIAALVVLALAVLSRIVLIVLLPPVIRQVAGQYGLSAQYERMELYLLDGDVGIWHFSLSPVEGGAPLVQADYTRCHVSILDLLFGRLTVRRLETEGVDLTVQRNADGSIPLLQRFAIWTNQLAPGPSTMTNTSTAPMQIDLASPLEVDAFRLTSVHTHIIDLAVSPPLDTHVDLNLRLADLASQERPTQFEMDLSAPPILDLLHVEGTGTSTAASLDAIFHAQFKGLHPMPAAGYLHLLGIRPTSNDITLAMNARFTVTKSAIRPGALAANIALDHLVATADNQEAATLDKIAVRVDAVDLTTARIAQVAIEGGQCQLHRDPRGEIGVGGLQIVRPAVLIEQLSIPLSDLLALIPEHWGVGELVLRDMKATMHDQAVSPAADLAFYLTDLDIGHFSPDQPNADTTIHGRMTAPGIAGAVRLDGRCRPFAARKDMDLTLAADGIRPDALQPYLDSFGVASDYSEGKFSTTIHADVTRASDGTLTTNASLSKTVLSDTGDMLTFKSASLSNADYHPDTGLLHIKSIEISGPRLAARRVVEGAISALGLHNKPRPPLAAPIATLQIGGEEQIPESRTQFVFSIPKLRVDHFAWTDVGLQFEDQAIVPNSSLTLSDAGVEVNDLNVDFDPHDAPAKPGKIHAWLHAPDLVQSVEVNGTLNPSSDGMSADLTIDGKGVTAEKIAGYFQGRQVQPILKDGTFHLLTHMALKQTPDGVTSSLAVKDLTYRDGPDELLAVDSAQVGGVSMHGDELKVNQVAIHSPRISIARDADGSFRLGGVRISNISPAAPKSDRLGRIYQTAPANVGTPIQTSVPLQFVLNDLDLRDASLNWTDQTLQPAASAHLTASVHLQDVVVGRPAPPAKLNIEAHEDHALDRLTVQGLVTPSLDSPTAQLDVDAAGIRAGALGSYAGPDAAVNLQDGRFHAVMYAALNQNPAGGLGGHLIVQNLDYHDQATGLNLLRLDDLNLSASRVDVPGKTISLGEIRVNGLEANIARQKDGSVRALGLTLDEPTGVKSTLPATSATPANSDFNAVSVSSLAAIANQKYPLVKLDKLDIGIRKLSISDDSRPSAVPLSLSDMRLTNKTQIQLLGDNPQACPPADLELTGAVDPLVKSMDVHALLSPFADPATANVDVNLSGIHGQGVTDLVPDLKPQIDGSTMTDGRFTGKLTLQIKRETIDPLDTDFSKDFTAGVSVKGLQYKNGDDSSVLASVEELSSDDIRVQPKQRAVVVRDLEISNPAATVFRDAAGIHALGLVIKPAAWQNALAQANSTATTSTPAPSQPVGELAVNKLVIDGLNFNFTDRTCDPPLVVPLNGLDLEARDLTSRLIDEDKSCRFSVLLNAGKVPLPRRVHGNQLAGAVKDTFALASGKSVVAPGGLEERDLFSQVEASGIVSLYPKPKGWIKTSVSGLDLAALKGEAQQAGITLNSGTFDSNIDLRFNGNDTEDLSARFVFTDLELSEPAHGPIVRYLNVNAPLDVVIAALQDQDGSITVPIDVPIRSNHISGGDIALAGTGAVASVVTTAVATTPLKATDTFLDIFGNEKVPKNDQPIVLQFGLADHYLDSENVAKIQSLLQRAKDDQTLEMTLYHELSAGDLNQAAILANPTKEDCQNIAFNLRLKKFTLQAARAAAAQRAAAELASGFGSDADAAIADLRRLDLDLATTEDALDEVYDMLRPGADRQADRRTRAACLQIGQDRLLVVRDALLASQLPGIESRIKVTHATINTSSAVIGGQVIVVLVHQKSE